MRVSWQCVIVALGVVPAACGGKASSTPSGGTGNRGGGAAAALPGPCVEPVADATARQGHEAQEPDDRPGPDVDGDGAADVQVFTTDPDGMVTEHVFLYVMRGDCGHHVGDLGAGDPAVGRDRRHGLADLGVIENGSCEGAPCGCETGTTWFRFDGAEYRVDQAASTTSSEIDCPDDL